MRKIVPTQLSLNSPTPPTHTLPHRNTDHAKEDVLPACKASLEKLKVEYLDLYLVHWPIQFRKGSELWKLSDEDKLGYNPQKMAECWEVSYRAELSVYMYIECPTSGVWYVRDIPFNPTSALVQSVLAISLTSLYVFQFAFKMLVLTYV